MCESVSNGSIGITTNGWGGAASNLLAQSAMVAGQTRHDRAYYRDNPSGICTTGQNTSQSISIVVQPRGCPNRLPG